MAKTMMKNVATWEMVGKDANETKIEAALDKVGLNFGVEKRPIFFGPEMKGIKDKVATVRIDREECMGIVGKGYEICQNDKAFAFADYISSDLKFTRGGMTYTGLCWVIGEMPTIKILGEDYTPCLCLQNSFNGKYQLRANIVPIHRASGSQLGIALHGVSSAINVKHLPSLPSKMKQGQETLAAVSEYMDELRKTAEKFAEIKMTTNQVEMLMEILFPIRNDMSETVKDKVIKERKLFMNCYENGGKKNGAWDLILAYADYNTHAIGKDTTKKFEAKFMGTTLSNGGKFSSFIKKLEGVTGKKVIG